MTETTTTTPPPFGGWALPCTARQDPPLAFRASHFVLTAPGALKAIAGEIVAARPELHLVTVAVDHPRTRSRWILETVYRGRRQDVIERAAYHIATATCTERYEHMLPTISAAADQGDGRFAITIHANLYAGD